MGRIVTLTMNPSVDVSADVDHVRANRKLRCSAPEYQAGGGGINVARAVRELGEETVAVFPAGGPMGDVLAALLDRAGVTKDVIQIDGTTRESLTISEKNSDQQFRFVMPGPELSQKEWKAALDRLARFRPVPEFVVASGSLPPGVPEDFFARLARVVAKLGSRCVVDTSGPPLGAALDEGVYLLKPNRHELEQLAGESFQDEEHEEELARGIIAKGGCEVMAVSLGSAGALLVTEDQQKRMRSPDVTISSRVGAGDSMVAGIVVALSRKKPVEEAVRFGLAAGAAAVKSPGSELCRSEDAEALYERLSREA